MTNHDLQLNKFFLKKDLTDIVTEIADLKTAKLDTAIYYRPSNCPLINVSDSEIGSCFSEYYIPTGSVIVQHTSPITMTHLSKTVQLTEYKDKLYDKIQRNIKQIFDTNEQVYLCYSGGIDSLAILSFIVNLGLSDRVKFVINNNKISESSGCLYYNSEQQKLTEQLVNLLGIHVDWLDITQDDLLHKINHCSMEHVKTYSISCLFDKYRNTAFIGGWHGNQVLLHKNVFWDEICLSRHSAKEEITEFLQNNSEFYTKSLSRYDVEKINIVPIERVHMLQKPWDWFNGFNGNRLYAPLADDEIFQMMRQIDFSQVSVDTIAHATVAKEIIHKNVGSAFDQFIAYESLEDGDSLGNINMLPTEKIHASVLEIPENLNHSDEGLSWIKHEISKAKISGVIPFNSVMTLKMLHWIAML